MGPEAVENQYAGSPVSTLLCLRIIYMLEALQADVGFGISRFIICIMPSRSSKGSLVASMGGGWPNDYRV